MTYIISAGKGIKLQPLTLNHPKSLYYKLDDKTTKLQQLVRKIRGHRRRCRNMEERLKKRS